MQPCAGCGVSPPAGTTAGSGVGPRRDTELKVRILAIRIESDGIYGCPRIHAALLAEGERMRRKRVARLMKEQGIEGVTRRRFKTGATKRDVQARPAPDLGNRDFSANGPDQLWGADLTQVRTWSGELYLAVVLDAWSRRIVGWAMATRMPAELVDDAYDNTVCGSFFATLEGVLLKRRRLPTVAEAWREVFRFIEGFYHTRRLRSAIAHRPALRSSIMRPQAYMAGPSGSVVPGLIGRPRGRAGLPAGCRASLVHPRSGVGKPVVRTRV